MTKLSRRSSIVEAGLRLMFRKGFNGSGVRDIVTEASAPQGCFTGYFRSKEAFAVEVLDLYFEHVKQLVRQALDDRKLAARARLLRYLDIITQRLESDGFMRGCLIGDLSLETAQASELLRERLLAIYDEWREPFAACIREAQMNGEIATAFPPDELADFLIASWQGAILRMKVERSPAALNRFKRIAFQSIFHKAIVQ